LKPTRYLKIISSSVIRNIQIDLKYKFLLLTDVTWLIIDIFAFTLLGGMVDSATDVTYSMDVNVDVVSDHLEIYIYDIQNDYFEYSMSDNQTFVRLMEHKTGGEYGPIDGVPVNPALNLMIDGNPLLNHSFPVKGAKNLLTFQGRVLKFDLAKGTAFLNTSRAEHRVEISYTQNKGSASIDKGIYFGFDTFEYITNGSGVKLEPLVLDVSLDSLMKDEGVLFKVTDGMGHPLSNVTIYIDANRVGETDSNGVFKWEDNGNPIVHFRHKGKHEVWAKFDKDGKAEMKTASFLLSSPKNRLGIDYDLRNFLLVGVLFWAFFGKAYEDTVNTIPDEASRGTIGFLVTNNVSISTLLLSRNIASSLKTFIITMVFIIPPFFFLGVFSGFQLSTLPLLLLVFALMWFFMLIVSILISSLNIIFKKITPAAQMLLYALKVLTGYYFPLEALDEYAPGLSDKIKIIPIVKGAYFIRDVIIIGKDVGDAWAPIREMFQWTIVLAVITLIIYKFLEHKSQRWGTLEFY